MKTIIHWMAVWTFFIAFAPLSTAQTPTPLAANGRLKVINRQLCNEAGTPIQLRGMSTHGLQWFGNCSSLASTQALATQWGCDVLRAAMYVDEGGYLSNRTGIKAQMDNIIDWSEQTGMYCIVDWHILNPGDPNAHTADAIDFFKQEAQRNAGKKHVIYELCNEPNGVSWSSVKSYAEQIIPVIRQYDPEAIILVGTPNWSGTPGDVTANPITGANAYNIMYTFHFYAGSHYTQSYISTVLQTVPLFVSEWGTSNYSGNGGNDYTNAQNWLNLFAGANPSNIKVSWCNWSFCDKGESSAALNTGACGNGGWNNTSTSGAWVKEHLLSPADNWGSGTVNKSPTVSITAPANNSSYVTPAAITLSATAADADGTISKVEFFNGTTLIGTVATAPYNFIWAGVTTGTYSITAKATDNLNAVTSSAPIAITVRASNANQNPIVALTRPTNNAQYTTPISIIVEATASDPDGTIAKVEFFNGATLIKTMTVAPYSFSWTNLAAGTYNLTAKATDNLNATTTSSIIQFVVNQPNTNTDLIGVNCANLNDVTVFELNANQRANATNYNWWCNGSTQSIVPVSGQPYKATFSFGQWFTGGNVCVGVNYAQAPWYKQFCKNITRCTKATIGSTGAVSDGGKDGNVALVMRVTYPNPTKDKFTFTTDAPLQSLRVLDHLGRENLIFKDLEAYQTLDFGANLPVGVYFLEILEVNQVKKVLKIVKTI
ncbi:MAG: hypothetical protein RLZZ628_3776 [Bacteroidota bacterium]|jgi:hypothetical protein